MRVFIGVVLAVVALNVPANSLADEIETVAVIGTGDMGNSLGPKLASLGYHIVYGSRDPARSSVVELVNETGGDASAATALDAAQSSDIVLLAIGWPAMEQVAQNLGDLSGKIVIDVSFPFEQGPDGYPQSMVETSSAEMIQGWNPGAHVVKWSLPTAYYIDEPMALGQPQLNLIAANDRASKEKVAQMAHAIGQLPFDAGPLRMSRAIEAQVELFMVPLYQRRTENWENTAGLSSYWSCIWDDSWSEPVSDADNLAQFPKGEANPRPCSDYPKER